MSPYGIQVGKTDDEIRAEILSSTHEGLMQKYQVLTAAVKNWEKRWKVHAKRKCAKCNQWRDYSDMSERSRGGASKYCNDCAIKRPTEDSANPSLDKIRGTALYRIYGDDSAKVMVQWVDSELADHLGVKLNAIYRWETSLGVRCRRRCVVCDISTSYYKMRLNKSGRQQLGICIACDNVQDRDQSSSAAREVYDIGIPLPMPATPGPLRHQYQGRTAIEMEQAE